MRALKFLSAAVAAIVVILALVMIVGVPSGFLTSTIKDRVERETGYRLTIAGSTKISLWPTLNVTMNDLTLQEPKDREGANKVTIGSLQADMTLSSAWSGHPEISELIVTKPVLSVPLLRERHRAAAQPGDKPASTAGSADVQIDRITVIDGAVAFSNSHDKLESRIDTINAKATFDSDRKIKLTGSARSGSTPMKFDIKATVPVPPIDRQNIPVELTLEAPGALNAPLSAKAEVRLNGPVVLINGLSGSLDEGSFSGWGSVDVSSKPLVKVDLDFQRFNIPGSKAQGTSASARLERCADRPLGAELYRRPGEDFGSADRLGGRAVRAGRDRCDLGGRRAEGVRHQSRRLWRASHRRSHRRCLHGKSDLPDALRSRRRAGAAAADESRLLRQARRQDAGEDRRSDRRAPASTPSCRTWPALRL